MFAGIKAFVRQLDVRKFPRAAFGSDDGIEHHTSAFLRSLGVEIRQYGLNLRAVAIRTTRMRFLVLSQMLTALEHFAALAAAILIGGHHIPPTRQRGIRGFQKRSVSGDERW